MTATQLPFLRSEPAGGEPGEIDTDLVAEIQRLLATLGHDPGPADGILGQRTRAAIADFVAGTGAAPRQPLPAVRDLLYRELALRSATTGPTARKRSGG